MINSNYFIYSAFGRKRRLPEAKADNRATATHAARIGLNFLVQSVASDVNLLGLIDTINWIEDNNLQEEIRVFATVHDSVVAEVAEHRVDEYVNQLRSNLQKDRGVNIPGCSIVVDVEIGDSWGDLEKYEGPK
jgi:DNA polymerase I-like protein with 3'-5' exonuclease and polymerase domains